MEGFLSYWGRIYFLVGKDFFPNDFFFSGELFPSREKAPREGFQSTSGRILRKSRNEEKKKGKEKDGKGKGKRSKGRRNS